MKPRFTITLIHYHWSCGDGCCSDSGYKLYVVDHQPEKPGYNVVIEDTDWDFNRFPDSLRDRAVEAIQEKIGRDPINGVDYQIIEEDKDNDEECEEEN